MTDFRLGFAGAGGWASGTMAPVVHRTPGVVLQSVASRDEGRARALGPVGRIHSSYEALVDDPDVDGVYVVLSNDLHRPVAEMAMRAGKPVLCEKPLALDSAEVDSMFAVSAETGQFLLEGFWQRWHPRTIELERMVRAGELGALLSIDSGFGFDEDLTGNYRLDATRGGGAAYDVGCYAISFVMAAMGDAVPHDVALDDVRLSDGGVDLMSRALLTWNSGTTALTTGSYIGPDSRWGSVTGELGTVVAAEPCFVGASDHYDDCALVLRDSSGAVVSEVMYPAGDPRVSMVADFAAVARGEKSPEDLPTGEAHSRAVMVVLDRVMALVRSAAA